MQQMLRDRDLIHGNRGRKSDRRNRREVFLVAARAEAAGLAVRTGASATGYEGVCDGFPAIPADVHNSLFFARRASKTLPTPGPAGC
jgi:hypothetical protein